MSEPKRPLKVFLCHAHADREAVRGLYTRLTKDGVDVWLDEEKLLPGQDWELEIRKAVREADVVAVCLSKQFNQAGFRQKEVRWALDTAMEQPEDEIYIVPARLEECDNIHSLKKWHWVDLFEQGGYEMLLGAFRMMASKKGMSLEIKGFGVPSVPDEAVNQLVSSGESKKPADSQYPPLSFELPVVQLRNLQAYGIAVVLGLIPVVLTSVLNIFNSIVLLITIFLCPGVWAMVAHRRWIFFTAYSIMVVSIFLSTIIEFGQGEVDISFLMTIITLLIFGIFVDVFLFQICMTKKHSIKVLVSFTAGIVLVIALVLYDIAYNQTSALNEYIAISFYAFTSFLGVSYAGTGFARVVRKIWPHIFEVSLRS